MTKYFDLIVELVLQERERQDTKWGSDQTHTLPEWTAILGEEFGEFCQEVNRVHFGNKEIGDLVAEAIQTAAVCFALLEDLFRPQPAAFKFDNDLINMISLPSIDKLNKEIHEHE